jgi:hypothetical protein
MMKLVNSDGYANAGIAALFEEGTYADGVVRKGMIMLPI